MYIDNEKLNELLNSFGLSLKIENGNAIFIDVETNLPMKTYKRDKEGRTEEISEAERLLTGWPFYLENESKYFELIIRDDSLFSNGNYKENIRVSKIDRIEEKEQNLYERCLFESDSDDKKIYSLEEMTYIQHENDEFAKNISYEYFVGQEIGSKGKGYITVGKNRTVRSTICFEENTGEITLDSRFDPLSEINLEEARELVNHSKVFRNTLNTLCPKLAESYSNTKTNNVGPTK